jgi:hypothetical protein
MKRRGKKKVFSAVKAVKANARERVGQPKGERVIREKPPASSRDAKYKETLGKLLGDPDSQ